MARRSEEVVAAVVALAETALSNATVKRDCPWPERPDPGGTVIIRDGDPGEPSYMLSPLTYTYTHAIRVEFLAPAGTEGRHEVLDAMLVAFGEAIEANRTLGGLCEWVEPSAAETDDVSSATGQPVRAAMVDVTATYSTSNPLL